jgi:hypothetical protein
MKSSKAEVLRRVEEVFKLRLGGAEFADIVQYASAPEQNWGVSARQLWNYIAAADKLVQERFDARAEHLLNRHLLQRRTLYAHAMGAGDFRTALSVLQDEAKLEALYPAARTELTGQRGGPVRLTLEDLLAPEPPQGEASRAAEQPRPGGPAPGGAALP